MVVERHKIEMLVDVNYEVEGEGPTAVVTVRFMGKRRADRVGSLSHSAMARLLFSEIMARAERDGSETRSNHH